MKIDLIVDSIDELIAQIESNEKNLGISNIPSREQILDLHIAAIKTTLLF